MGETVLDSKDTSTYLENALAINST